MQRKRISQFKVDSHISQIFYDPVVDKHLEYFFANKNNRQILVHSKIVNRKNEIIDRSLSKMVQKGQLTISNSFRLKKKKISNRYQTINTKKQSNSVSKTVGKKQFEEFLANTKNQVQAQTIETTLQQEKLGKKKAIKTHI